MIDIDMAKWSKQAGVSEVELGKAIIMLLAWKAEFLNIPQTVILAVNNKVYGRIAIGESCLNHQ